MIRKIALAGALIAGLFTAGSLATGSAQAMTISTPKALGQAAGESNVTDVAYVCRRVWRYGRLVRSCWWRPGPAYGYGYGYGYRPYYAYRPYAYYGYRRPYYRPRYW